MKAIHQDDYNAIGTQHEQVTGRINDTLIELQNHAYTTGVERGKELAKQAAVEAGTIPPTLCQTIHLGAGKATIETGHMLDPAGDEVATLTIANGTSEVRLSFESHTRAQAVLLAMVVGGHDLPTSNYIRLDDDPLPAAAQAFADAARPNLYPAPDKPDSTFGKLQKLDAALAQHHERISALKQVSVGYSSNSTQLTALQPAASNARIDALVSRFLAWPLPDSVCADECASVPGHPLRHGTNLLTANEAKAMLLHVFGDAVPVERTAESDWHDEREEHAPELAAAIQAREEAISQVHGLKTQLRDFVAAAQPIINALAGPGHHIREMQATLKINENNPIIVLAKLCAAYRKQQEGQG